MPYHRFHFNKLVRDNVPSTQRQEGCRPEYAHIGGTELSDALSTKLLEEAAEARQALQSGNKAELIAELADLQEVMLSIMRLSHITPQQVAAARKKKAAIKGGFTLGIFEKHIDIPTTHPEAGVFLAQPEKYPYGGLVD